MKTTIETVTIPKIEYDNLCSQVTELSAKVEWLMEQFRLTQHRRFGASSEKSVGDGSKQLNLFNESEIASDIPVPEPELVEIEKHFLKRKNMVNEKNLPDNVPVETFEHELPAVARYTSRCGK